MPIELRLVRNNPGDGFQKREITPSETYVPLAKQALLTNDANALRAYDTAKQAHPELFGRKGARDATQHLEKARAIHALLERFTGAARTTIINQPKRYIRQQHYKIYVHLKKAGQSPEQITEWFRQAKGLNIKPSELEHVINALDSTYTRGSVQYTHPQFSFSEADSYFKYTQELKLNEANKHTSTEKLLRATAHHLPQRPDELQNLTACNDLDCGCSDGARKEMNYQFSEHIWQKLMPNGLTELTYVTLGCENLGTDIARIEALIQQYTSAHKPIPKINMVCVDWAYTAYLEHETTGLSVTDAGEAVRAQMTRQCIDDLQVWASSHLPAGSTISICGNAAAAKTYLKEQNKTIHLLVGEGYYSLGNSPKGDYSGNYNTDEVSDDLHWLRHHCLAWPLGASFELTQDSNTKTNMLEIYQPNGPKNVWFDKEGKWIPTEGQSDDICQAGTIWHRTGAPKEYECGKVREPQPQRKPILREPTVPERYRRPLQGAAAQPTASVAPAAPIAPCEQYHHTSASEVAREAAVSRDDQTPSPEPEDKDSQEHLEWEVRNGYVAW